MCRIRKWVHLSAFVVLFVFGITLLPDEFESSYNRAIVRQYDYFKKIEENTVQHIGSKCQKAISKKGI